MLKLFWSLILLFATVLPSHAQHWKLLGTVDPYPTCGYFWDSSNGIVACAAVESDLHLGDPVLTIFRTSNAGRSWTKCYTPVGMGFRAAAVAMKDAKEGLIALAGPYANRCDATAVLSTRDGGYTWVKVDSIMQWDNVQYVGDEPIFSNGGISVISENNVVISTASEPGCNWKFRNGDIWRTTDRGVTWSWLGSVGEAFGSAYDERSGCVLVYPELVYSQSASDQMYVSEDSGVTWEPRAPIYKGAQACGWSYPGGITGDVRSFSGVTYVQSCGGSGLYRSNDAGLSWKRIGGPSNDLDTRFCILPSCSGGNVVAFARDGGVWLTTDGGDGTLAETPLGLSLALPAAISACSTSVSTLTLQSNNCENSLTVDSIWFEDDTHFQRDTSETLPMVMGGAVSAKLHYTFTPSGAPGDYVTKLHVHGRTITATDTLSLDTVFTVLATARATGPAVQSIPSTASLGTVSLCSNGVDSLIVFINRGCDNDSISLISTNNPDFTTGDYTYPVILTPGDTLRVRVHFRPRSPGKANGALTIRSSSQGITSTVDVPLSASVTSASSALSFSVPAGDTTHTTCDPDTTLVGDFVNTGCDSVHISSLDVKGVGFELVNGSVDTVLAPGERAHYFIRFRPTERGTLTGTVSVRGIGLQSNVTLDTSEVIVFQVGGGSRVITQSVSSIDFGPLNICQDSAAVVELRNTGCDTLTITSADLTGQGFACDGSLPIVLKPGEFINVTVHSIPDTTGHPASVTGVLQFTSTAQNALPPIPLTRGFTYPATLKIEAVGDASGHAGDEVKFNVILEGDVPKAMTALHFDVSNDDDLLSFVSSNGVVSGGMTGGTRGFTLSPVTDTGVIGELSFRAYLAKASTTTLTLSNLHFDYPNLSVPPDCIASLEASGSSFTYIYKCGEGLIQQYMQTGSFAEESYPNPVSGIVTVPVTLVGVGERSSPLHVRVWSVGGATVHDDRYPAHEGLNDIQIDTQRWSSGTYHYTVEADGQVIARKSIVVQK